MAIILEHGDQPVHIIQPALCYIDLYGPVLTVETRVDEHQVGTGGCFAQGPCYGPGERNLPGMRAVLPAVYQSFLGEDFQRPAMENAVERALRERVGTESKFVPYLTGPGGSRYRTKITCPVTLHGPCLPCNAVLTGPLTAGAYSFILFRSRSSKSKLKSMFGEMPFSRMLCAFPFSSSINMTRASAGISWYAQCTAKVLAL